MKRLWELLKQTVMEWIGDSAPRMAAAVSYYAALSLAPLVLVAVAIAGLAFGQQAVEGQLVEQMQGVVGPQAAQVIQTILQNAVSPATSILAMIVGLGMLLLGATGVFLELQSAMDVMWDVEPKSGQGVWGFVRTRLLSLAMVLGVGVLLLASLIASAVFSALGRYFAEWLPGQAAITQTIHFAVSLGVITLLFATIFKVLPDAKIAWRDVWLGALVTAVLFTIGKTLIGLYLGHAGVGSAYGAAGSLIVLLVWMYYSALILFLGAEFTQVWAQRHGRPIEPKEYAQKRLAQH